MRSLELSYPWGTNNLQVVERPDPQPGHGEVVVRMRAVSLNFRDTIIVANGGYAAGGEGSPPVIPFSDGCGIVESVGEGVTRVAVGDRVSTLFFPNWSAGPPEKAKVAGARRARGRPRIGTPAGTRGIAGARFHDRPRNSHVTLCGAYRVARIVRRCGLRAGRHGRPARDGRRLDLRSPIRICRRI